MFQRSAGAKLLPLNRQSKAINISKITSLKKLLECFPLVEEASQRLIEAQMLQMFNSLYLEIILGLSPAIFLSLCILCKHRQSYTKSGMAGRKDSKQGACECPGAGSAESSTVSVERHRLPIL